MFVDRKDAGMKLAAALEQYKDKGVLVLAIPRGGVEVGYEVARHLNGDFSIIMARKLPFPLDPEAGFGAVAEDGSVFMFDEAHDWFSQATIERTIAQQRQEITRRIAALRGGKPLPEIAGRTVILVDDGIAMGATMRVAVQLCRARGAEKVVVAAPVAGTEVAKDFESLADELVVLDRPPRFRAIAHAYRNWYDVPDWEVVAIMERWQKHSAER